MILDSYNRRHNYLRISLTDNCNMRCFYCMPEEEYEFTPSSKLMQEDEIMELATLFVRMGVDKIRLTGGEPLVRKGADRIIRSLSTLPVHLTLTTNGSRLHEYTGVLREARIRSVNISLDTLDPAKFQRITRRDQFQIVMDNIQRLISMGIHVKINMVVMRGVNDNELPDFIGWTRETPVHVRFIEFMPFSGNKWVSDKVFTWKEMLGAISNRYSFNPIPGDPNDTAKKYYIDGHAGTFAVISTMSAPFCDTCNRMRLTADGKMKNCLFSKKETDLLSALRNGQDVESLIRLNIWHKEKELGGQFSPQYEKIETQTISNRSMITIGG